MKPRTRTITIESLGPKTEYYHPILKKMCPYGRSDHNQQYRITVMVNNSALFAHMKEKDIIAIASIMDDRELFYPKTEWWHTTIEEIRQESLGVWYVWIRQEWLD